VKNLWFVGALGLALICSSCGGNRLYPVSGKVLYQGAPAAGAVIFFRRAGAGASAMNEPTIMGLVREDGSFTLVCGSLGEGAPSGQYDVLIEWRQPVKQAGKRSSKIGRAHV